MEAQPSNGRRQRARLISNLTSELPFVVRHAGFGCVTRHVNQLLPLALPGTTGWRLARLMRPAAGLAVARARPTQRAMRRDSS